MSCRERQADPFGRPGELSQLSFTQDDVHTRSIYDVLLLLPNRDE